MDLFQRAVCEVYSEAGESPVANDALYAAVQSKLGLSDAAMAERTPIGRAGAPRSLIKRKIRWAQQSARALGLVERTGTRGEWRLRRRTGDMGQVAGAGTALLAFSTKLGLAIWARCESVFPHLREQIACCLTSPPYLLARQRAYAGPGTEQEYIEFIVRALEPVVRQLLPGGSIALNITNDAFESGMPTRSLYRERLVLALCSELGLHKADELVWHKISAAPGPYQWASRTRQQLNAAYEPIYIFTPDPKAWFADNRRVLEPHTPAQKRLIARGGEARSGVFSDGAYRVKPGSFGNPTVGRIPRNVWSVGHRDRASIAMNAFAKANGLQPHGAPMPYVIAERLVRYLTRVDDLVVDLFGGRLTTAAAAEANGRRWLVTEQIWDHLVSGATRFGKAIANGESNIQVDTNGSVML
ncbi:site-specific DNA-methyltransferase [Pseudoxanthomonas kaohsiungensis]|nr:site-specific DNA-methyltransferase [Pseudoxanthomonas kaohsiungensis]